MEQSRYVIRGGREGRERLRVLSRVMGPTTRSLFERVGVREGMACLDVGCGGGDVTLELARRVGARGRVVGIDIDETKIQLARREAQEAQRSNVEFRVSDFAQSPATAEFDVVYARFVLTHLSDPAAALSRMCGQLRPGGMIVVEDIDFRGHFCDPDHPALGRYVELYTQTVHASGSQPRRRSAYRTASPVAAARRGLRTGADECGPAGRV